MLASETEIVTILESAFSSPGETERQIATLKRRPFDYSSSFSIEQLSIGFADGQTIELIFKNLSPQALLIEASRIRSSEEHIAAREILVYEYILAKIKAGTPTCYASRIDPQSQRYWLFLEMVKGRELYQVGEFELWRQVSEWLARFHQISAQHVAAARELQLSKWDRMRYQGCLERGLIGLASRDDEFARGIEGIFHEVVDRLLAMSQTVIHGEFYASNILIQESSDTIRVCPIDWETAAVGPGLLDLAALVAGKWTDEQRFTLAETYWTTLDESQRTTFTSLDDFHRTLLFSRFILALQMLGRPSDWLPPEEHRHDWFKEARTLLKQLRG